MYALTLLAPLIARGLGLGLVLTAAMAVVLLLFAGGYWYLVARNHQADDTTDEYVENERGPQG